MKLNKNNIDRINPVGQKPIRWIAFQPLIGGMSLGAEAAFGCPPLCVIDFDGIDKANSSAYMGYMNDVRGLGLNELILNGNLLSKSKTFKTEKDTKIFNEINHNIDVVSAVPICSGLSTANAVNSNVRANARGSNAVQNNNMLGCAEFVFQIIKPKVYIFENAPTLFSNSGKGIRDKLTELGRQNGYAVTYVKTNSFKHNNPQHRSRTFAIYWRNEYCPKIDYIDSRSGSILEYLAEIPADSLYNSDDFMPFKNFAENGFIRYLKSLGSDWQNLIERSGCVSVLSYINNNGYWREAEPYLNGNELKAFERAFKKHSMGLRYFDDSPLWYGMNKVSTLFGRSIDKLIHPSGERGYTLRELLKFMGMPDDFEFESPMKNANYICQNVPVLTAMDWHLQIREYLEGRKEMTNECLQMFNNESGPKEKVRKKLDLNFGFKLKK